MTFDKFTIKAQEVVQQAVNTAQQNGQQTIEPVHILKGILLKGRDVANFIFQKLGVNAQQIETLADQEIQHLPRVQGGQPYLSTDANNVLAKSQSLAKQMGDEFVSVETILLAVISERHAQGNSRITAGTEGELAERRRELSESRQIRQEPRGAGTLRQTRPSDRP